LPIGNFYLPLACTRKNVLLSFDLKNRKSTGHLCSCYPFELHTRFWFDTGVGGVFVLGADLVETGDYMEM
jgi:hypothetical protein